MHRTCVLAVLVCLAHAAVNSETVVIHFSDGQGREIEKRSYNVHRAIFGVSAYMKEELERHQCTAPVQELQSGQPEVTLACDSWMFDVVADLLDENVLNCEIGAREVAEALKLASLLKIKDVRMRLYRNLASAAVNEPRFRSELEMHKDVPDIKLFVLQFMRENVGLYEVDVRVYGNQATLCPKDEQMCKEHGKRERIRVIDTIVIQNKAMKTLMKEDEDFMRALRFYVYMMDISALVLDYCKPDRCMIDNIACMQSLTRLSMKGFGNDKLRGLRQFSKLKNLAELDISGNKMNRKRLRKIGELASLTKLNIEGCGLSGEGCCGLLSIGLRCLEGLEGLEVLCVGRNKLKSGDVRVIARMRSLQRLEMGRCGLGAGAVKHLEGLKGLEEFDISENTLGREDLDVIGKMKGLRRLRMDECRWKPFLERITRKAGSLERLKDLCNLVELSVSSTCLNGRDMVGIGSIENLVKLKMSRCSVRPGSIAKLLSLLKLKELRISEIRKLNKKDHDAIHLLQQRGVRVEI